MTSGDERVRCELLGGRYNQTEGSGCQHDWRSTVESGRVMFPNPTLLKILPSRIFVALSTEQYVHFNTQQIFSL